MDHIIAFTSQNWGYLLLGFMVLEKVVKLSPATWDDILVDGIKWTVTRLAGKEING